MHLVHHGLRKVFKNSRNREGSRNWASMYRSASEWARNSCTQFPARRARGRPCRIALSYMSRTRMSSRMAVLRKKPCWPLIPVLIEPELLEELSCDDHVMVDQEPPQLPPIDRPDDLPVGDPPSVRPHPAPVMTGDDPEERIAAVHRRETIAECRPPGISRDRPLVGHPGLVAVALQHGVDLVQEPLEPINRRRDHQFGPGRRARGREAHVPASRVPGPFRPHPHSSRPTQLQVPHRLISHRQAVPALPGRLRQHPASNGIIRH